MAFMIYFIKKLLELKVLNSLSLKLNICDVKNKKNLQKIEMFREHAWELIYYSFATSFGLVALWNEPFFWNFSVAAINYPFHVIIDYFEIFSDFPVIETFMFTGCVEIGDKFIHFHNWILSLSHCDVLLL